MNETDEALAKDLSEIITSLPGPDFHFAESILRHFRKYQKFTPTQRIYIRRFIDNVKTSEIPIPSTIVMQFPNLCALLNPDKFAHFQVGKFRFSLKRDGSIIWVMYEDTLHGMIDTRTTVFRSLSRGLTQFQKDEANSIIFEIESDPMAAAKADGVLTGRCSLCGRTLTDAESIKIGVGPICLKKAGWL